MSTIVHEVFALDGLYQEPRKAAGAPKFYLQRRRQLLQQRHSPESATGKAAPTATATTTTTTPNYVLLRQTLLTQKFGPPNVSLAPIPRAVFHNRRRSVNVERTVSRGSTASGPSTPSLPSTTDLTPGYTFKDGRYIFSHHQKTVTAVRFAHGSTDMFACGSLDGTVSLCYIRADPEAAVVLRGHDKGVTDVQWSADNTFLISTSNDATIRLWRVADRSLVRTMADTASVLCCQFNPDNNNLFVIGNKGGDIKVYNLSTGKTVPDGAMNVGGAVTALAFEPLGRLLFVGNNKGELFVFTFASGHGRIVRLYKSAVAPPGIAINSLAVAPSFAKETHEPCLLVSAKDNLVKVYGVGSFFKRRTATPATNASPSRLNALSTQLKNLPIQFRLNLQAQFAIKHEKFNIEAVFCPLLSMKHGPCFATGTEGNSVEIFRALPGKLLNTLKGHEAPVLTVCWNTDESFLVSGDVNGVVIVWRIN